MIELNKKRVVITSLSIGATICILIFLLIWGVLTGGSKYSTPDEWFFSSTRSTANYNYDIPHRKLMPIKKIVELPLGDKKVLYLGYVKDVMSEDISVIVSELYAKEDLFYLRGWHTLWAEEFENKSVFENEGLAYGGTINYYIVPYDSVEKDNYDPEIYNSVETEYIDSKGEKQHVMFFYTWEDTDDNP